MVYNRFFPYKVLAYRDKIEEIVSGEMPIPIMMHIYPSNRCPYNCSHCIMKKEKENKAVIPLELLYTTIGDCQKYKIKTIHLSGGGEPFAHPVIYDILKFINTSNIKLVVSTNGFLFMPKAIKHVDDIRISFDASNKETYAKVHGTEEKSFDIVVKNIKKMREEKKRSTTIGLGFLILPENYGEVYDFCKLAERLRVDFVHIRPAWIPEKDEEIRRCTESVKRRLDNLLLQNLKLEIHFITTKFNNKWSKGLYDKCRATPLQAVLKATGEFAVCQDMLDITFGNYSKQNFLSIWNSEEHKKAIEKIKLDKCPRCVETIQNEVIEQMFMKDNTRLYLI